MSEIKHLTKYPALSNAPITEAVLEIRGPSNFDWNDEKARSKFILNVPDVSGEERLMHARIEVKDTGIERNMHGCTGVVLALKAGKEKARFAKDTFAFSRTSPYEGWNAFLTRAFEMWEYQAPLVLPQDVSQIGLRYINQIPLESVDVAEIFLREKPPLVGKDGWASNGFFLQSSFVSPSAEFVVKVTTAIRTGKNSRLSLIIDIDIISSTPWCGELKTLKYKLDQMREIKNKYFFDVISDEAILRFS